MAEETPEEKAERRAAYKAELKETAWAAYHLNWPQNSRGFGPWANEQISFSEARKGSVLGLGIVDNPFSQTDAEARAEAAKDMNRIRGQVRDAFNRGQLKDVLARNLGENDHDLIPRDLKRHYGIG